MQEYFKKLLNQKDAFKDIIGQDRTKRQLTSALLMNRNVIIMGPPGVGKTTLAKNVSKLLPEIEVSKDDYPWTESKKIFKGEERFVRVQGSPDLTAEDLIGDIDPIKAMKFGPLSVEAFTPGKIFKANKGILFFDEVNRCPEKLQNSLLQVLQEKIATVGSYDIDFPAKFIFIGTMNPEDSSTEKLSHVFMDRFDIVYMGYPETLLTEKSIVLEAGEKLDVEFPDDLLNLTVYLVRAIREDDDVQKKPSVRASIGLYERAQSNAFLDSREVVDFNDIKEAAVSVLSHRIELKPSIKYLKTPLDFIKDELKRFEEDMKKGKLQDVQKNPQKLEKQQEGGP